jgi:hypothetical protein
MEPGILSLSASQTNPETGLPFPARQRIDEIISYATLADRLGLDVFGLGEHHSLDFAWGEDLTRAEGPATAAMEQRIVHFP